MQVPIQFFQVTAAALLPLLVAAGLTGRLVEASTGERPLTRHRQRTIFAAAVTVGTFALIGEVASLTAMMRGGANALQGLTAGCAVLYGVLVVFALMLEPVRRQEIRWYSNAINVVMGVATVAAVGVLTSVALDL